MLILPNNTAGLASSSGGTQVLFFIHLAIFFAIVICGFMTWTVIRVTDRFHGLGNFLIASTALVNCVFGSPLVLLNIIGIVNSGSWWFGVESCILGQVIESCIHAGTAWVLAVVSIVWCRLQYQYPALRCQQVCLQVSNKVAVAGVWVMGCAIGIISTVASAGSYHVKDGVYSSWTCIPNYTTITHSALMFTLAFCLPLVIAFTFHIALTVRLRRKVFSQVQPMSSPSKSKLLSEAQNAETEDLQPVNQLSSVNADIPSQVTRSMSQPNMATGNPYQAPSAPKLTRRPSSANMLADLSLKVQCGSSTLIPSQNLRPQKRSARLSPLTPLTPVSLPKLDTPQSAFPPWFVQPLPLQVKAVSSGSFTVSDLLTTDMSPITSGESSSSSQTSNNELEQDTMTNSVHDTPDPDKLIEDVAMVKDKDMMDEKPARFLYKRSELPKDCDNWPTVFLTADVVDQTLTPSSSPELYRQKQSTPEQGVYPEGKLPPQSCLSEGKEILPSNIQHRHLSSASIKRINVRPINQETSVSYANDFEEYHQLKRFWYLIVSHLFLWFPHYVVIVAMATNTSPNVTFEAFVVVELIGKMAMVINPLLFFLFEADFREALRSVIVCRDPNGYANEVVQLA